jgi:hypothetical protein
LRDKELSMPPFTAEDAHLAAQLYAQAGAPNDRALLDWFIDHPDVMREGYQLAADLGFPETRLVARSTYNLGRIAASLGRARPWTEGQMGYLMPAANAELFAQARSHTATP